MNKIPKPYKKTPIRYEGTKLFKPTFNIPWIKLILLMVLVSTVFLVLEMC